MSDDEALAVPTLIIDTVIAQDYYASRGLSPDIAARVVAALGANGYVVVSRHLLDELLDAAEAGESALWVTYTDKAHQRLKAARAAVVEAVGPTTPETCSTCNQPLDSPPCSLNRDTGWSGHTVSGGVVWSVAVGPTT